MTENHGQTTRTRRPIDYAPAHRVWRRACSAVLGKAACTVALAVVAAAQLPQAVADESDAVTVTVTAPYIDMRTGPGRGYPIYHVAERHETLQLIKSRTDWYKVSTADGKTGWVHSSDLSDSRAADGALVDFTTSSWRGYTERHWELGLQGGDLSSATAMHLHLGYRMLDQLSAEGRYVHAFGDASDSKLASVNLVHRPFPQWRLTPFFTLGAGTAKITPHTILVESEDRRDDFYTVGAGVVYYVTHRFGLRAEYNHHTLLTTRDDNEEVEEWKAGFSVSF